jgi:membrane-associated phospholipid phosphatase
VPVARVASRIATPSFERILRALTGLADEKTVITGATLLWFYTRLRKQDERLARETDHIMACALLADALPRLTKLVFARQRPDRTVARRRHRGIPRSGEPWDSFPSGHAILLGALTEPLARLAPRALRIFVAPAMASIASTRVLLLAHYLTDVAAGFALGLLAQRILRRTRSTSNP